MSRRATRFVVLAGSLTVLSGALSAQAPSLPTLPRLQR